MGLVTPSDQGYLVHMHHLEVLRNTLPLSDSAPLGLPGIDGIGLETLGVLHRRLGGKRWKRSPAGTGRNVDHLRNGLRAHGLTVYSEEGNRAAGDDGHSMASDVLRYLSFDDYVIVLDRTFASAASLADGLADYDRNRFPNAIAPFGDDQIRNANERDVVGVFFGIVYPLLKAAQS